MIYIFSKDTKNYIYTDFTKLKLFVSYDYLILVNHLRNKYLSKYCKVSLLYLYIIKISSVSIFAKNTKNCIYFAKLKLFISYLILVNHLINNSFSAVRYLYKSCHLGRDYIITRSYFQRYEESHRLTDFVKLTIYILRLFNAR